MRTSLAERRGGRPAKAEADRRSIPATVWMTPAEAGLIRHAAKTRGESVSSFLVAGGRGRAGQPVERLTSSKAVELRRALGPIGNNLNQLARSVNLARGKADGVAEEVAKTLEAGQETLEELRRHVAELLAGAGDRP